MPADSPENFALIASWDGLADPPKPLTGFEGPRSMVHYVPANSNNDATEVVAEWLVQQEANTPEKAKRFLTKHARDYDGRFRVHDFGIMPHGNRWDDPEIYKPVEE